MEDLVAEGDLLQGDDSLLLAWWPGFDFPNIWGSHVAVHSSNGSKSLRGPCWSSVDVGAESYVRPLIQKIDF